MTDQPTTKTTPKIWTWIYVLTVLLIVTILNVIILASIYVPKIESIESMTGPPGQTVPGSSGGSSGEITLNTSFTWQGIWAAPRIAAAQLVKSGSLISIFFSGTAAGATISDAITSVEPLPDDFRPSTILYVPILVRNNSNATSEGRIIITPGGEMRISLADGDDFDVGGESAASGFPAFSVSFPQIS